VRYKVSSVVQAPPDEVFAWFAAPGAAQRLTPPWSGVRFEREADDLAGGRAVLRLPLGARWTAEHDPAGFVPGRQFVDEARSFPVRQLTGGWRHVHTFTPVGDDATLVGDEVSSFAPGRVLRPVFAFRHRQLAEDLAALRRSRAWRDAQAPPLTVAVTGSGGTVGQALTALLTTSGHRVVKLVRRDPQRPDERRWDVDDPAADLLDGVDVVVHLAGESIAGRFDADHRRAVLDSRVGPTRKLAERVARSRSTSALVCASAVGLYGPDRGDCALDESAEQGEGFLAEVVAAWESACEPAKEAGTRVAHIRTGVVQSAQGGMLRLLWPLFWLGLGGKVGDGGQWLAWIALDDLADIYRRAVLDDDLRGPINAVAPEPVRNAAYTKVLGDVLGRFAVLPVPKFGPRLLLGAEGADELAFASQRVVPARLQEVGHTFRYPAIRAALAHELGRETLPE
jgi:uncharacterized protein (TIGR01777 family)